MLLFLALTIYVYHLGIERDKNIKLSNQHILSEMEKKQYEQIISSIDELRYLKHDIHNHIQDHPSEKKRHQCLSISLLRG